MGFVDGRNLEERSVALTKMEVDVATLAQLSQEVSDRQTAVSNEAAARIAGDNASNGALGAHINIALANAPHSGPINSATQISDTSIGMSKLNFVPALQGDFSAHHSRHVQGGADAFNGDTLVANITGTAGRAYYSS